MKILFLTMSSISSINESGLYSDLMREFMRRGHTVFIVSPTNTQTSVTEQSESHRVLCVKTGQLQKCGLIKKGIATLKVPSQFTKAIKKYFKNTKFDLIIYSTPPITLYKTIKYFKKRDGAKTYLLLKDIFPMNAVDIGILTTFGVKGLIYKYFRRQEKKLYAVSDFIGCMSPANAEYLLNHNKEVSKDKVGICPNCIEPKELDISLKARADIRLKYGIPQDKVVFVYGGNLGKPQGIPFIIECLKSQKDNADAFFLIVGAGTDYPLLEDYFKTSGQTNLKVMQHLPKGDFDTLVAACDVGLIFLDYRFTIPNFPSRLLSYMQAKLPVLAATDVNTDVGKVITEHDFGWRCESDNVAKFDKCVSLAVKEHAQKACNSRSLLYGEYSVSYGYKVITDAIQ